MEKKRKQKIGRVIGTKMDKTMTILIERRVKHPLYGKVITRSTKLHAHDEENTCAVGDVVSVLACRPRSKSKSWELGEIIERAAQEGES